MSRPHRHRPKVTTAIKQREGVPFEVERSVCQVCGRLLAERPIRRAAA